MKAVPIKKRRTGGDKEPIPPSKAFSGSPRPSAHIGATTKPWQWRLVTTATSTRLLYYRDSSHVESFVVETVSVLETFSLFTVFSC